MRSPRIPSRPGRDGVSLLLKRRAHHDLIRAVALRDRALCDHHLLRVRVGGVPMVAVDSPVPKPIVRCSVRWTRAGKSIRERNFKCVVTFKFPSIKEPDRDLEALRTACRVEMR